MRIAIVSLSLIVAAACSKKEPAKNEPGPAAPAPGATTTAAKPAEPPPPSSPVLGKPAPDFTLAGLDGKEVTLSSFKGKVVVLEWFNPGCPFVVKSHTVGSLVDTAKKHTDAGVVWIAINSGAEGKQGFPLEENQEAAKTWALGHPIVRDVTGATGKAYGATNTPNMFVIDAAGTVVYAGAIDNSPDGERGTPTGGALINYIDAAIADLAAGRPVATPLTRPYGCGVKYSS